MPPMSSNDDDEDWATVISTMAVLLELELEPLRCACYLTDRIAADCRVYIYD